MAATAESRMAPRTYRIFGVTSGGREGFVLNSYEIKRGAVLRYAKLAGANLRDADLYVADLSGADLSGADLRGADLRVADLSGANLRDADLYGADLYGASLTKADLYGANLSKAYLADADLYGADLRRADLRGANLHGATLRGADLSTAAGIVRVGVALDGYEFFGVLHARGAMVLAGCRWFTIPEARKHWTETRGHTPLGKERLGFVDLIEAWEADETT